MIRTENRAAQSKLHFFEPLILILMAFITGNSRGNMGKITQFRGWFSNIFLNVESPTAPIEGSRTSQQTRVRRCVETVRLILCWGDFVQQSFTCKCCWLLFVQQHFATIITHVTPWAFELCTRIIRVCINLCIEIAVESNMKISNISTLKSSVYDLVCSPKWDIWALDVEERPRAV